MTQLRKAGLRVDTVQASNDCVSSGSRQKVQQNENDRQKAPMYIHWRD